MGNPNGVSDEGGLKMKAKELIQYVESSDSGEIDSKSWGILKQMVKHYEHCKKCRERFNDMEYSDTLLDLVGKQRIWLTKIEDWICEG